MLLSTVIICVYKKFSPRSQHGMALPRTGQDCPWCLQ
jgi:hypothetical protein